MLCPEVGLSLEIVHWRWIASSRRREVRYGWIALEHRAERRFQRRQPRLEVAPLVQAVAKIGWRTCSELAVRTARSLVQNLQAGVLERQAAVCASSRRTSPSVSATIRS